MTPRKGLESEPQVGASATGAPDLGADSPAGATASAPSGSKDSQPAKIPLPARGGGVRAYALVDAADHEALSAFRWFLGSDGYARRFATIDGRRRSFSMHREILGQTATSPGEIDHINRNRLDNRRANLRVVTRAQNCQNAVHGRGRSGHRNIYWHEPSGLWHVQFFVNGSYVSGGYFARVEDAVPVAAAMRADIHPLAVGVAA